MAMQVLIAPVKFRKSLLSARAHSFADLIPFTVNVRWQSMERIGKIFQDFIIRENVSFPTWDNAIIDRTSKISKITSFHRGPWFCGLDPVHGKRPLAINGANRGNFSEFCLRGKCSVAARGQCEYLIAMVKIQKSLFLSNFNRELASISQNFFFLITSKFP